MKRILLQISKMQYIILLICLEFFPCDSNTITKRQMLHTAVYGTYLKWKVYSVTRPQRPFLSFTNHPIQDQSIVIRFQSGSGICRCCFYLCAWLSPSSSPFSQFVIGPCVSSLQIQLCIVKSLLSVRHKLMFYFRQPLISQYFRIIQYHLCIWHYCHSMLYVPSTAALR